MRQMKYEWNRRRSSLRTQLQLTPIKVQYALVTLAICSCAMCPCVCMLSECSVLLINILFLVPPCSALFYPASPPVFPCRFFSARASTHAAEPKVKVGG